MAQGKQAKFLLPNKSSSFLGISKSCPTQIGDRVHFLLSIKVGLQAKEIASFTWAMVTGSEGQVADVIALEDRASKGRGGRLIPMNPRLRKALAELHEVRGEEARPERPVIYSERGQGRCIA